MVLPKSVPEKMIAWDSCWEVKKKKSKGFFLLGFMLWFWGGVFLFFFLSGFCLFVWLVIFVCLFYGYAGERVHVS